MRSAMPIAKLKEKGKSSTNLQANSCGQSDIFNFEVDNKVIIFQSWCKQQKRIN